MIPPEEFANRQCWRGFMETAGIEPAQCSRRQPDLGVTGQALPEYGIAKVANYAAQVARAQALGFDPDLLRLSDEEADEPARRPGRQP